MSSNRTTMIKMSLIYNLDTETPDGQHDKATNLSDVKIRSLQEKPDVSFSDSVFL